MNSKIHKDEQKDNLLNIDKNEKERHGKRNIKRKKDIQK